MENSASTGSPSAFASLSAITVEGTNTAFSTVLTVLRLFPIKSASCAWVRLLASRASRTRLRRSAKGAPFEEAEAQQRGHQAGAGDDVNHLARGGPVRGKGFDREQDDRRGDRHREAPGNGAGPVGYGHLVVHQLAHLARAKPEAARYQPGEDHRDQHDPAAVAHQVDRTQPIAGIEERRLLDQ